MRNSILLLVFGFLLSTSALAETALFKMGGKTYKAKDLPANIQQQLFDLEARQYQQMEALVDAALVDIHLSEVAKKKKKTKEEVELELFKVKPATDKQIKKFYKENKSRIPPNYKFEQVKPEIKRILEGKGKTAARAKVLNKIKKSKKFKLSLKKPVAPKIEIKTANFPTKGKKGSKVKIVEFADYQCPHCREASQHFKKLMKKYKNKVEMVFIDFPINRSGVSRVIAEGAYCAKVQKKYWEYHDMAFTKQSELKKDSPAKFAKALKLDVAKFNKCLGSAAAKSFVSDGKNEGDRVGVGGTPTIFFNGRKYTAAHTYEALKKEVDQLL